MPQLIALSWASAGDASPMRTPGTNPVPIAERVAAIATGGFCGFELAAESALSVVS